MAFASLNKIGLALPSKPSRLYGSVFLVCFVAFIFVALALGCASQEDINRMKAEEYAKKGELLEKAKRAMEDGFDEANGKYGNLDEAESYLSKIYRLDQRYDESIPLRDEIKRRRELQKSYRPPPEKRSTFEDEIKAKIEVRVSLSNFDKPRKNNWRNPADYWPSVTLINHSVYDIKNIHIVCDIRSKNGYEISGTSKVIYQDFRSLDGIYNEKFDLGEIDGQAHKIECRVHSFEFME